jgi:hypothetical protein
LIETQVVSHLEKTSGLGFDFMHKSSLGLFFILEAKVLGGVKVAKYSPLRAPTPAPTGRKRGRCAGIPYAPHRARFTMLRDVHPMGGSLRSARFLKLVLS